MKPYVRLVPKKIVDKNGKQTTVLVRMDEPVKSTRNVLSVNYSALKDGACNHRVIVRLRGL